MSDHLTFKVVNEILFFENFDCHFFTKILEVVVDELFERGQHALEEKQFNERAGMKV